MAIILFRRPRENAVLLKKSVVAIGNFDGLHIGHQQIFHKMRAIAIRHDYVSVLITFEPYPKELFSVNQPISRLTSFREKMCQLEQFSLDYVYVLPFDQKFSFCSAEWFICHILKHLCHTACVVIGKDFKFGYQRKGDIQLLQSQDFLSVQVIPSANYQSKRISSTWIREVLKNSDFNTAEKLLGRPYSMIGRVIQGQQLGRQLGFPTANIALLSRITLSSGVYVVNVICHHVAYNGVANIGIRPTVNGQHRLLEVYLLDFDQNIYGQYIKIIFCHKIREEKLFNGLDALKAQISRDVRFARDFFNTNSQLHKASDGNFD